MFIHGDAYLTTISMTTYRQAGHFIVWDEVGGAPLMKVDHQPILDAHNTIVGVRLQGMTKDEIEVDTDWMGYDRRNSETHGRQSFILAVGCLVGQAIQIRKEREREREPV